MKNYVHARRRYLLLIATLTALTANTPYIVRAQTYAQAVVPVQRTGRSSGKQQDTDNKRSVKAILFALEDAYHVSFNYDDALLTNQNNLNEDFSWNRQEKLGNILDRLESQLSIRFEKADNTNYLLLPPKKSNTKEKTSRTETPSSGNNLQSSAENTTVNPITGFTQQSTAAVDLTITGTVVDETGNPLPGVNVLVKGTSNGTTTDADGKYTLVVDDGTETLVFSFIGYTSQEVSVSNRASIAISLVPDVASLQEVVVVGYGEQKRTNVLGAVATVQGTDVQDIPSANLSTLMKNRMAGVTIGQTSGKPGASTNIQIRKVATFSLNTAPLYVIDGFIYPDQQAFDLLDPTEVESISILKDASAAVYGARGANGVIVVKTKRGKAGSKPKISYSGSIGVTSPTRVPKMLSAYDQAQMINDGLGTLYQNKKPGTAKMEDDPWYFAPDELEAFKGINNDWLNEAWKNSTLQRHALNISGGSDKIRYFVSGTYYNENGSFDQLYARKYTIRANVEADITKNLKATWLLSNNYGQDERPYFKSDQIDPMNETFRTLLQMPRWLPSYIDGKPVGNNVLWHPQELINGGSYIRNRDNGINMNFALDYSVPFVKGLSLKAQYGRTNTNSFGKQYLQPYTLYNFNTTGSKNHLLTNEVASTTLIKNNDRLYESYDAGVYYQLNATISYAREFGKHNVSAMVIYEQAENTGDSFYAQRENMLPGGVDQLFAGSADAKEAYGTGVEGGRLSYLGRLNYSYNDKYLLETAFRYEGSTKFAPEQRWGLFPSVAAGWRISEENFFRDNISFIDQFKLRASYGMAGADAGGDSDYRYLQSYSYQTGKGALFGNSTLGTGMAIRNIPYLGATWEKRVMYNYGFDASLFDNRISLSVDNYFRKSSDIFVSRENALPTTVGATLGGENYGKMNAWGWDIELGYNGEVANTVKYYIKGNLSWGQNRIIQTYQSAGAVGTYKDVMNKPLGAVVGYHSTGIIRTQADLDKVLEANPTYTIFGLAPQLGMMNYTDIRGANLSDGPDGKIDENDQDNLKYSNPVNVGATIGASWKSLRIDANFGGAVGGWSMIDKEVYKQATLTTTPGDWKNQPVSPVQNTLAMWKDHWTPENPNAAMPRAFDNGATEASTFWLRRATVIRLNNVNVSYAVPQTVSSRWGLEGVRVFFTGTNLFTVWDDIKYKDPGASLYNSYPFVKTYTFGLNLTL